MSPRLQLRGERGEKEQWQCPLIPRLLNRISACRACELADVPSKRLASGLSEHDCGERQSDSWNATGVGWRWVQHIPPRGCTHKCLMLKKKVDSPASASYFSLVTPSLSRLLRPTPPQSRVPPFMLRPLFVARRHIQSPARERPVREGVAGMEFGAVSRCGTGHRVTLRQVGIPAAHTYYILVCRRTNHLPSDGARPSHVLRTCSIAVYITFLALHLAALPRL